MCAGVVAWDSFRHAGRVLPGVWVEGRPAAGLTPHELREFLEPLAQRELQRQLVVRAGGSQWTVRAWEAGLRVHVEDAVREAYGLGRHPHLGTRLEQRWRLRRGRVHLHLRRSVDPERLSALLDAVAKVVGVPPHDGRLVVHSGRVVVVPSRSGLSLGRPRARRALEAALVSGAAEADLPTKVVEPRWTTQRLLRLGIVRPVATFSTRLAPDPDRTHNVALAASRLRGVLLPTGSELSFNRLVGPRTRRAGFREAPVLVEDELVPGDGGGVCQVSTTLFNAALLADLTVLSRANHSRPVPYVPVGRDATVVYGAVDLRVRNQGPPLLLWTEVEGSRLVVTFHGPPRPDRTVRVLVDGLEVLPPPAGVVVRTDPRLREGEVRVVEAQPGYRATTVREVWEGTVRVRREVVARSWYRPVPRTVKVGARREAGWGTSRAFRP